jgi:hypothetical protein
VKAVNQNPRKKKPCELKAGKKSSPERAKSINTGRGPVNQNPRNKKPCELKAGEKRSPERAKSINTG